MTEQAKSEQKICFVIGPIGEESSDARNGADWLLETIIKPVLSIAPFNYEVIRADSVTQPGLITDQVISHVIEDALVVADLTGHNANAFYELAIRHMEEKPTIHMIEAHQNPPFDIQDYRAIKYKLDHPSDLEKAKRELEEQAQALQMPGYKVSNPITRARGQRILRASADSRDQLLAELRDTQSELLSRLKNLEEHVDGLDGGMRPGSPLWYMMSGKASQALRGQTQTAVSAAVAEGRAGSLEQHEALSGVAAEAVAGSLENK